MNYALLTHEVGVCLDFEDVPVSSSAALSGIYSRAGSASAARRALQLMVALPAADYDYDYAFFGKTADAIVLMNYDQHSTRPRSRSRHKVGS